jgi:hypothetical protein
MRLFAFIVAGILAILATILLFENLAMTACPLMLFFDNYNNGYFVPFLILFLLGLGTGIFLALGIFKGGGGESEYDDGDF